MHELRDQALLIRRIPYSDTSLVCHFLTEEHGRISLMARGARRAKSPFRATLAPLYALNISWRPGRTGMGTLVDIDRGEKLLQDDRDLDGLELCAIASGLFKDGDPHGYHELSQAIDSLRGCNDASALCIALWHMLQASGWVGDFTHCWHCGIQLEDGSAMAWHDCQLICTACGHGMAVSAGMRKGIGRRLLGDDIHIGRLDLSSWQQMIQDVLGQHGVKATTLFQGKT